ncbi:MAG TPA: ABC transporter substrate-binding protein, partial [Geobacteraceae bacterium]
MSKYFKSVGLILIVCLTVVAVRVATAPAGEKHGAMSKDEVLRLGERIYREGLLPSGKPLEAIVKGDLTVEGSMFSCQSCHMRGGLGSFEGGIYSPPTNGAILFKAFQNYSSPDYSLTPFTPQTVKDYNQSLYQKPPNRPLYTDSSLAEVLRYGDDPTGRILNDAMPRYVLEDADMAILISYLRSLSSEFSPGVTDKTMRFATIISEDVPPAERNAMLVPLEYFIRSKNQTNFYDMKLGFRTTAFRSKQMAAVTQSSLGVALRELLLSRWELKGPPDTWRAQLEEYYRREPVFAILGGITSGDWQPVHRFCEDNRIPCIFPMTDFPVISRTDWYTVYLSKGYYQEGEGAARFLKDRFAEKGKTIVQIVRDSREGRSLARGFQDTWADLSRNAPVTVNLKEGEALTPDLLREAVERENPAVILIWDGPASLKALNVLAARKNSPMVMVSSSLLGMAMLALPEPVRDFTYMTYPYGMSRSPEEQT